VQHLPDNGPVPSPLSVVIVEDDVHARAALRRAVASLGHECRAAASGADALRMVSERRPDVVISDWAMPAMNGDELCRRIRDAADGVYTYFILVSGAHDPSHLLAGMAAGADDYQTKPVDLDELEARLVSAARVVALHRRLAEREHALLLR
jgi:DNA-binding response OmpR family regulator